MLEKITLIKHISELCKKFKPVKECFDFYINQDKSKQKNITLKLQHTIAARGISPLLK